MQFVSVFIAINYTLKAIGFFQFGYFFKLSLRAIRISDGKFCTACCCSMSMLPLPIGIFIYIHIF